MLFYSIPQLQCFAIAHYQSCLFTAMYSTQAQNEIDGTTGNNTTAYVNLLHCTLYTSFNCQQNLFIFDHLFYVIHIVPSFRLEINFNTLTFIILFLILEHSYFHYTFFLSSLLLNLSSFLFLLIFCVLFTPFHFPPLHSPYFLFLPICALSLSYLPFLHLSSSYLP